MGSTDRPRRLPAAVPHAHIRKSSREPRPVPVAFPLSPPSPHRLRRGGPDRHAWAFAPLALGLALALAGCGSDADAGPDQAEEGAATAAAGYPDTVENCGTEVTFDRAPQRVVTIKSTSTELLLALGLKDRIVGQTFQDGPVPEQGAEEAAGITTLSDEAPSQEVVLEQEPDLVLAGWESNLAADTAGERDLLAKLGVATYVSPAACQDPKDQPDKMTYDLLFDQFEELGAILGASDAAADLVRQQRAVLAEVPHAKPGTSALWWSSGEDTPYVGGGIGAPQMVLEAVGLDNVVGDIDQTWTSLGWEAIVDADPDVIVLVDAAWNPAQDKIDQLESNPATAELTAVREGRYLVVPFPAAEAGVRPSRPPPTWRDSSASSTCSRKRLGDSRDRADAHGPRVVARGACREGDGVGSARRVPAQLAGQPTGQPAVRFAGLAGSGSQSCWSS